MGRAIVCGIVVALAACARPQPPVLGDALERSAKLLARLDQLEADLHQQDAELFVTSELEWRHGQAQQMACQVTGDHLREIHRLAVLQQEKQREKAKGHKKGRTIAQAKVPKPARVATN
jgi:hypothetical protein